MLSWILVSVLESLPGKHFPHPLVLVPAPALAQVLVLVLVPGPELLVCFWYVYLSSPSFSEPSIRRFPHLKNHRTKWVRSSSHYNEKAGSHFNLKRSYGKGYSSLYHLPLKSKLGLAEADKWTSVGVMIVRKAQKQNMRTKVLPFIW